MLNINLEENTLFKELIRLIYDLFQRKQINADTRLRLVTLARGVRDETSSAKRSLNHAIHDHVDGS